MGTIIALANIPAGEASVIFATQPVLILAIARLTLGERTIAVTIALALVSVGGVVLTVSSGEVMPQHGACSNLVCAVFHNQRGALHRLDACA